MNDYRDTLNKFYEKETEVSFDQNRDFPFNPDLSSVLKNNLSRYSLVVATAKRAEAINDEVAGINDTPKSDKRRDSDSGKPKFILEQKPVSIAIDELIRGEYVITEDDDEE